VMSRIGPWGRFMRRNERPGAQVVRRTRHTRRTTETPGARAADDGDGGNREVPQWFVGSLCEGANNGGATVDPACGGALAWGSSVTGKTAGSLGWLRSERLRVRGS